MFFTAWWTYLNVSDSQNSRRWNIPPCPIQEPSTLMWFVKNDRYHIDGIFRRRTGKSICQLMHLLKWEQARQKENVILEPNGSGKSPPGITKVFGICYSCSDNNKPPRNYDPKKAPSLPYIALPLFRNGKCGHIPQSIIIPTTHMALFSLEIEAFPLHHQRLNFDPTSWQSWSGTFSFVYIILPPLTYLL